MAQKYTPAPWKFAGFRKASNFADHTAIVQADNCNLVSVRGGVKDEKSVAEANARLIAAAPELLEAAKLANELCELITKWAGAEQSESYAIMHEIVALAQDNTQPAKAIAKAEDR